MASKKNFWEQQIDKAVKESMRHRPEARPDKPKRSQVWAVDFDGTLCDNNWPEIGEPRKEMIQILKLAQTTGVKLILWTCREGDLLQDALEWCKSQDLYFDVVNDNLPERQTQYGRNPRKVGADLYIDDRSFPGVEGSWRDLCQLI